MDLLSPSLPFIYAIQKARELLLPMQFFSFLGAELFYLALLPLIYWGISRPLGACIGALLLFSGVINEICKVGFALPRPYWLDASLQRGTEMSFGFPSGHAQNAFLMWLFLALGSRKRALWVPLALVLALLISFSRLYLGVHFPADVIGGAFIGLVILALAKLGGPAWLRFWRQLSTFQKVFFAVTMTVFLFGIYSMALFRGTSTYTLGYGNTPSPAFQETLQRSIAGGVIASRLGAFFGFICGLAFAARNVRFEARVPLVQLAPRLMLGFAVLLALYFGLKVVLPNGMIWSFVRYALTTFWVGYAAPLVFCKMDKRSEKTITV